MLVATMPLVETRTALTPDELLRQPDSRWLELVYGRTVDRRPKSHLSNRTVARIVRVLESFVERSPVAEVYTSGMSCRCFQHLTDDSDRMRRPDVSVVRRERFLALNDPNPGLLRIPPDLAVEVVSTHDVATEIDEKVAEYQGARVRHVWVVYPIVRRIIVYPTPGKPYILTEEDSITAEAALPGFACKVSDLFPPRG